MKHIFEKSLKPLRNFKLFSLFSVFLILFAAIVLSAPKPVLGQAGMTITSGMGGGASSVARVRAQAMQLHARLSTVETCSRKGMVYASSEPGADADGCILVTEVDPKVGTLSTARLCHSDGSQVICDSQAPSVTGSGGIDVAGNVQVGGTVTGNDATFSGPVAGATPTASNHLTTKNYVDTNDSLGDHLATADLDMNGNPIINLAGPTSLSHAATKGYVDSAISSAVLAGGGPGDNLGNHTATTTLNMAGNSISGVANPNWAQDAATKAYVDAAVSGVGTGDDLGNHTATETLDMSSNRVTGVATPIQSSDATTKAYVDSQIAGAAGGTMGPGEACVVSGGILSGGGCPSGHGLVPLGNACCLGTCIGGINSLGSFTNGRRCDGNRIHYSTGGFDESDCRAYAEARMSDPRWTCAWYDGNGNCELTDGSTEEVRFDRTPGAADRTFSAPTCTYVWE